MLNLVPYPNIYYIYVCMYVNMYSGFEIDMNWYYILAPIPELHASSKPTNHLKILYLHVI